MKKLLPYSLLLFLAHRLNRGVGDCNLNPEDDIPYGTATTDFMKGWATEDCRYVVPTDLPYVPICLNEDHSACEKLMSDSFSVVSSCTIYSMYRYVQ